MEEPLASTLSQRKTVHKLWGWESWVVNRDYCGKILRLEPGFQCSLHRHKVKDETFLVIDGVVEVELGTGPETQIELLLGWAMDSLRIPVGTYHRFQALDRPATMIEFSTHHEDDDTERLEDSRAVVDERPF